MSADPTAGPVLYGFTLGLVAAVNPCGFPLLPAYLMLSSADEGAPRPALGRAMRAVGSGAAMTVGFVVVFGILGLVFEVFGGLVEGWVPWLMAVVGGLLVVYGVLTVLGRRPPIPLPRRLPRGRGRALTLVVAGVLYAVASIGCSLPIFIVGVADDFGSRGPVVGLAGALAYALGMGLVVIAVALAGTGVRTVRLGRLRAVQPVFVRAAGGLIALIGGYLVLYWVTDLTDPLAAPAPVRFMETVETHVASALSASPRLTGGVIGAIVVVVMAGAALRAARSEPAPLSTDGAPGPVAGRSDGEPR